MSYIWSELSNTYRYIGIFKFTYVPWQLEQIHSFLQRYGFNALGSFQFGKPGLFFTLCGCTAYLHHWSVAPHAGYYRFSALGVNA